MTLAATPETDVRPCTCHPDDNPPVPCPRKYALTDCRIAAGKCGETGVPVAFCTCSQCAVKR